MPPLVFMIYSFMGQKHHLFPTSIHVDHFYRNFTEAELELIKQQPFTKDISTDAEPPTNTEYTTDVNIIKKLNLKDYEDFIINNVNEYMFETMSVSDDVQFYISRSWIAKTTPGGFGRRHDHINSILSGVMYFEVPVNSGNILFHAPEKKFGHLEFSYKNKNENNAIYISIPPQPGQLIIFPSTLKHEIGKNLSDQARYSLAFDIWCKGKISSYHNMCVIDLV